MISKVTKWKKGTVEITKTKGDSTDFNNADNDNDDSGNTDSNEHHSWLRSRAAAGSLLGKP